MDFLWNNHGSAFQVARVVICKKISDYLGIVLEKLWKSC